MMTNLLNAVNALLNSNNAFVGVLEIVITLLTVVGVVILHKKYPNFFIVSNSITIIFLTLMSLLGCHLLIVSTPSIALVIVVVFVIFVPCVGVFFLSIKHLVYLIKLLLGKGEFKIISLVFSIISAVCLIVNIVVFIYVFAVVL